ncbi:unnamed protein product, partial [Heterotrigona itama]
MQTIRPKPTKHHSRQSHFIFNKIFDTSHVFIRVDHLKKPLEQSYEGKETTVSTERLKPAFIEDTENNEPRTYARLQVPPTLHNMSSDSKGGNVATATPAPSVSKKYRESIGDK